RSSPDISRHLQTVSGSRHENSMMASDWAALSMKKHMTENLYNCAGYFILACILFSLFGISFNSICSKGDMPYEANDLEHIKSICYFYSMYHFILYRSAHDACRIRTVPPV